PVCTPRPRRLSCCGPATGRYRIALDTSAVISRPQQFHRPERRCPMSYLKRESNRRAPQSAPIPGSSQVPNSAGGFAWAVDDWARLRRFLILGSEGGSYYAREWKLTRENAAAVERCVAVDGARTVAEIVAVSAAGRAPKNDPAIFALAVAAGAGD